MSYKSKKTRIIAQYSPLVYHREKELRTFKLYMAYIQHPHFTKVVLF